MVRKHLSIEIALMIRIGFDIRHHLRRIEQQKAEPGGIRLLASPSDGLQPLSVMTAF
jgi:hypothetical protein